MSLCGKFMMIRCPAPRMWLLLVGVIPAWRRRWFLPEPENQSRSLKNQHRVMARLPAMAGLIRLASGLVMVSWNNNGGAILPMSYIKKPAPPVLIWRISAKPKALMPCSSLPAGSRGLCLASIMIIYRGKPICCNPDWVFRAVWSVRPINIMKLHLTGFMAAWLRMISAVFTHPSSLPDFCVSSPKQV